MGDARRALQQYRLALDCDDALPPEHRRLSPEQRADAAARLLEESLAPPPAGS
jgi:hypothetical protein